MSVQVLIMEAINVTVRMDARRAFVLPSPRAAAEPIRTSASTVVNASRGKGLTMNSSTLLALLSIGTRRCPIPAFEQALIAPRAIELHGDGYALRYTLGKGAPDLISGGALAVRNRWAWELLRTYRKEQVFRFDGLNVDSDWPRARLTLGGRHWETPASPMNKAPRVAAIPLGRPVMECPLCRERFGDDDAMHCLHDGAPLVARKGVSGRPAAEALAPVDFMKGGPVDRVFRTAAQSEQKHPWQHAVHLAGHASATNGCALAREELRVALRSPALVPLPFARALVALVTETSPGELALSRAEQRAWFKARLDNGDRWILTGRLLEAPDRIDYARVGDIGEELRTVKFDASDFRAVLKGFTGSGHSRHLAVFPGGGLVAWGSSPEAGIGSTLADYKDEAPIFVFDETTIAVALAALPKEGAVALQVNAGGLICRVAGQVLAGVRYVLPDGREAEPLTAGIPSWVHEEILLAHGLAERIPEKRPTPAEVIAAAFAAEVERMREECGPEVDPEVLRARSAYAMKELADRCVFLTERNPEFYARGLGSDLAGAVLACSRLRTAEDKSEETMPTYLVFDPEPFVQAAMPAPVQEEPKSGKQEKAIRKKGTKRAKRAAA